MTPARATSPLHIRTMTAADVPAAVAVMDAGGWPGRTPFLEHLLRVPRCELLVAEIDGAVIGTGLATVCGPVGWVGTIFVDRPLRRRGYGEAITAAVCERLTAAGCETLALIASEYGRPVYERMGFRIDAWHHVYRASPAVAAAPPPRIDIRRPEPDDLPAVFVLDRQATGSDRSELLRSVAGNTWVAACDGEVAGFCASIDGSWGAIVSPDPRAAAGLLSRRRSEVAREAHAAIVGEDAANAELLTAMGWEDAFHIPRMLLGPSVEWRPGMFWGILGPSFG